MQDAQTVPYLVLLVDVAKYTALELVVVQAPGLMLSAAKAGLGEPTLLHVAQCVHTYALHHRPAWRQSHSPSGLRACLAVTRRNCIDHGFCLEQGDHVVG